MDKKVKVLAVTVALMGLGGCVATPTYSDHPWFVTDMGEDKVELTHGRINVGHLTREYSEMFKREAQQACQAYGRKAALTRATHPKLRCKRSRRGWSAPICIEGETSVIVPCIKEDK